MSNKEYEPGDFCKFLLTGDRCMVVKAIHEQYIANSQGMIPETRYLIRMLGQLLTVYPCEIAKIQDWCGLKKAKEKIEQLEQQRAKKE